MFAATIRSPQSLVVAEPLDVAAGGLPVLIAQEALTRVVDREVAEIGVEVKPVQDDGLSLALLHGRVEDHAVGDRVREAVSPGARQGQPQPVLHERRHLEVAPAGSPSTGG